LHVVRIPKRKGSYRTVYIPTDAEKQEMRSKQGTLNYVLARHGSSDVIHGFVKGRSPVTNAARHVGFAYTLTFDLRDFFDSCTESLLEPLMHPAQFAGLLPDGAARQGLPTSPTLANIAATTLDTEIDSWCRDNIGLRSDAHFAYTRYADDLTISFNDQRHVRQLLAVVPQLVTACGFRLAEEKTHLYSAEGGRRIVTGVSVGPCDLKPTRGTRRKLRAAKHQGNVRGVRGLTEWMKLKRPKVKGVTA
jgi:hypothetical protein